LPTTPPQIWRDSLAAYNDESYRTHNCQQLDRYKDYYLPLTDKITSFQKRAEEKCQHPLEGQQKQYEEAARSARTIQGMFARRSSYPLCSFSSNGFCTCALGVLATDNNLYYGQFMPVMFSAAHSIQQSTSKPLSPLHPSLLAIREVCVDLNLNSAISTNFRNRLIGRGTHAVSVSIMKLNDEEHGCASHHLPSVLYEAFLSNAAHRQSWILVDLDKWGIERKKKLLQSSVMTELLPVTQLTNSDTLLPIIRDVFHCESRLQ
jgi:hypothetical protein